MRSLGARRYLVEWAVLLVGLLLLGEGIGVVWGLRSPGFRASVFAAVLVVGLVDLLVYVLVARGLLVDPAQFMLWWGVSVLSKLVLFGILGGLLVGTGSVERDPFLLSLAAAFPVFTAHQVLRLVGLADANAGGKAP